MTARSIPFAATHEGRFLLALKCGPVAGLALRERLGDTTYAVSTQLWRKGLVTRYQDDGDRIYSLTPAGRALLPTRRSLLDWMPAECLEIASDAEAMETGGCRLLFPHSTAAGVAAERV